LRLTYWKDVSYGNDCCASVEFCVGNGAYVLWVEYEDKTQRETKGARYTIYEQDYYEGGEMVTNYESGIEFEDPAMLTSYISTMSTQAALQTSL
jgi:hypothetical protein